MVIEIVTIFQNERKNLVFKHYETDIVRKILLKKENAENLNILIKLFNKSNKNIKVDSSTIINFVLEDYFKRIAETDDEKTILDLRNEVLNHFEEV